MMAATAAGATLSLASSKVSSIQSWHSWGLPQTGVQPFRIHARIHLCFHPATTGITEGHYPLAAL